MPVLKGETCERSRLFGPPNKVALIIPSFALRKTASRLDSPDDRTLNTRAGEENERCIRQYSIFNPADYIMHPLLNLVFNFPAICIPDLVVFADHLNYFRTVLGLIATPSFHTVK